MQLCHSHQLTNQAPVQKILPLFPLPFSKNRGFLDRHPGSARRQILAPLRILGTPSRAVLALLWTLPIPLFPHNVQPRPVGIL